MTRFQEAVLVELARAEGRALVLLPENKQPGPFDHFSGLRANFLAQLIATREHLPQTRTLRREAPDVAVAIYGGHAHAAGSVGRSKFI
jgi:hypothetical protein